jgi:hypothetical protein
MHYVHLNQGERTHFYGECVTIGISVNEPDTVLKRKLNSPNFWRKNLTSKYLFLIKFKSVLHATSQPIENSECSKDNKN